MNEAERRVKSSLGYYLGVVGVGNGCKMGDTYYTAQCLLYCMAKFMHWRAAGAILMIMQLHN